MGLWAISQWCRPQRLVRLPGLALLSVLALGSSIAHSRERLGGIIDQYFHLYVLLAGALFIVCGAWLVWLVATYATPRGLTWIFVGVSVINALVPAPGWLLTSSQSVFLSALCLPLAWSLWHPLVLVPAWHLCQLPSYSALAAVCLTSLVLLIVHRQWWWAMVLTGLAGLVALCQWPILVARWACRPLVWAVSWREWLQHPWLGWGMDTSIQSPMVTTPSGWFYRHQDFLALCRDYGVVAGLAILATLWQLWRGATETQRWLLGLLVLVMSVQTQAVFPRMMAFLCVIVGACAIREEAVA